MLLTSLQNINENKPLRDLCTLGVGGNAKYFAAPESVSEFVKILLASKNENLPVYVIGGGSNLIFPDSMIDGLVIATGNLSAINWSENFIEIQSGYKLPLLVKNFRDKNLGGLEFAAGIPGTLGGAIYGNAGTSGHGICELVESVLTLDSTGNLKIFSADDFSFEYRKCSLADEKIIIISAKIRLDNALSWNEDEYQKVLSSRKNQPLNFRSAGCTFKNPAGFSAGKLLDDCGCKNISVGGAVVSDKHANFILNINNASYSDIVNLIEICRRKVLTLTGINLEQEIKIAAPCFVRQ
ncbi:MAG: UDP-N-acetylmuramate dehydrogenase [Synergistaceae bacterium]|nr:UDP-N-acetylmuramate dehydrogenase [Synergistaceae bacterium]